MSEDRTTVGESIDVAALMESLRTRVAQKKARGHYSIDELMMDHVTDEPIESRDVERLRDLAAKLPDMGVGPSTKPIIGPVVSKVKRTLVAGTSEPLLRMYSEMSEFNTALLRYVSDLSREVAALKRQVVALGGTDARETSRDDDARRLAAESTRFLGSDAVSARIRMLLTDASPALQIGVGDDGLVSGVDGLSGVEAHRDQASDTAAEHLIWDDPLTVFEKLHGDAVGGVVIVDVVERVTLRYVDALLAEAARALRGDGIVLVVGLEPDAADAVADVVTEGGFPRRAVPAEIVARTLESAGFSAVGIEHPDGETEGSARRTRHYIVHARS